MWSCVAIGTLALLVAPSLAQSPLGPAPTASSPRAGPVARTSTIHSRVAPDAKLASQPPSAASPVEAIRSTEPSESKRLLDEHRQRQIELETERLAEQARMEAAHRKVAELAEGAVLTSQTGGISNYMLKDGTHLSVGSISSSGSTAVGSRMPGVTTIIRASRSRGIFDKNLDLVSPPYKRGQKQKVPLFRSIPSDPLQKAHFLTDQNYTHYALPWYEQHLTANPEDHDARVRYGLALLDEGKAAKGIEEIYAAYVSSDHVAGRSLTNDVAQWNPSRVRKALCLAVKLSHSTDDSACWLTASVLAEAEGRSDLARKMLARAESAGLKDTLAERISLVIASPPSSAN